MLRSTIVSGMLAPVLFFATGCASTDFIANYSTEYNKAVAKTNNEELLLNVLRAMKRRPMYFTFPQTIHGGPSLTLGSSTLTVPFGGAAATGARQLATSLGYTGTSGFDVGVVDTQEFMRGFTSAVDLKTLAYYWAQDWPRDLLWLMFVKKIEITAGTAEDPADKLAWLARNCRYPGCSRETRNGKEVQIYVNYPENEEQFKGFLEVSHRLTDPEQVGIVPELDPAENVGPPISKDDAVKMLGDVAKSDTLSLSKLDDGMFQLSRKTGSYSLHYHGSCSETNANKDAGKTGMLALAASTARIPNAAGHRTGECTAATSLTIYIRSPEAMVYYLGEIVRAGLRHAPGTNPIVGYMCGGPRSKADRAAQPPKAEPMPVPIFDVRKLTPEDVKPVISVEFDGDLYGVRADSGSTESLEQCRRETTTQTLSLVSQIIALQKSSKDLPSTGVVRVLQ